MTCPDCERLERQLEIARKELAFRGLDMRIAAVVVRIGCTPAEARTLLALYDRRGPMLGPELARAAGVGKASVSVIVCRLRDHMGENAVITDRSGGYSLSVPTHAIVMAALEPVDLARVVEV